MNIYAIIPARAGSKGIPNKNIRCLAGLPLLAYSIAYARKLSVNRIFCSTDSPHFADVARSCGAEVPFLRSPKAAGDTAMEEDILMDMEGKWGSHGIPDPDILVWLRPTFVLRSVEAGQRCINRVLGSENLTSCRTVCESETRIYSIHNGVLRPRFDDRGGRSMIRRQDVGQSYKVFSLDVFRYGDSSPYFLGNKVGAEIIPKVCGLDLDDEDDWEIMETLLCASPVAIRKYLHTPDARLTRMADCVKNEGGITGGVV